MIKTLFCFPSAGSSAALFYPWKAELAASQIELISIDYPGRGRRFSEPFAKSVESLSCDLLPLISAHISPTSSYALFGHSLGSIVAFEIAKKLETLPLHPPEKLLISAKHAPNQQPSNKLMSSQDDQSLISALTDMGGLPKELLQHRELLDIFLPIIRSDLSLNETYHSPCDDQVNMPIIAFNALEDPMTEPEKLNSWRHFTSTSYRQYNISGNHFYFQQHFAEFIDILITELSQ